MPLFHRYMGIDYSGAATRVTPLRGLTVFVADREGAPRPVGFPESRSGKWSRQGLAVWLRERLLEDVPSVVGIDHAFSYPIAALEEAGSDSWDGFLEWFEGRWPTREVPVQACLDPNLEMLRRHETALRLTDCWAPTAMPLCSGWGANGPNVFFSTAAAGPPRAPHPPGPLSHLPPVPRERGRLAEAELAGCGLSRSPLPLAGEGLGA